MKKCDKCDVVMIGNRYNQIKLECPICGKVIKNPKNKNQTELSKSNSNNMLEKVSSTIYDSELKEE